MTGNRTIGNRFEYELAQILSEHGFWVHILSQNKAGQPADLIAVKGNIAVLIDAKVCSNDRFPISRIEANQLASMNVWKTSGNGEWYFAMKLTDRMIYMVPGDRAAGWKTASMNKQDIEKFRTIEGWCRYFDCVHFQ